MFEKNNSTKWIIFETAIVMFSEMGYAKVSMRDIGKKVGVSAASIYNHFKSKDEILTSIYDFYEYHMKKILPDINKLLKDAETEEIHALLKMTDPRFEYEIQVLIYRIMVILNMERNTGQ